jgi:hypothetical protein
VQLLVLREHSGCTQAGLADRQQTAGSAWGAEQMSICQTNGYDAKRIIVALVLAWTSNMHVFVY